MKSYFVRLVVRSEVRRTFVGVVPMLLGALTAAHGQLITPKTVPIHQDDQFAIFPTARAGMAGVSIALDDTLADPFANPAKATNVRIGRVFTAPFSHGISAGHGGGSTLPVGGVASTGPWAVAGVVALQKLNHGPTSGLGEPTAANQYGSLVVARRLPGGVSVGGSAYLAGLNSIDGVDLLYSGSDRLIESGSLSDFRLGTMKEWGGRRLELLVLNNNTHMTHDVHFTTTTWNTATPVTTTRSEHNVDQTTIWGAHTQYVQPVGDDGWRVGLLATANRLSHPKIPNYQIQNIPRDPGTTYGFNVGMGASRIVGTTSFGFDVIEEPMFSDTWGTAANDTAIVGGGVLRAGDKTVLNHFAFANRKIRLGVGHDYIVAPDSSAWGFQLGMAVTSINYRLHQTNNIQQSDRVQDQGWTEWTPTFGLHWRSKDFTVQYLYRRTCGPSACIDIGMGDKVNVVAPSAPSVIAASVSPMSVNGGTSHVHQLTVEIPIR
jgi:hypothetical protein